VLVRVISWIGDRTTKNDPRIHTNKLHGILEFSHTLFSHVVIQFSPSPGDHLSTEVGGVFEIPCIFSWARRKLKHHVAEASGV